MSLSLKSLLLLFAILYTCASQAQVVSGRHRNVRALGMGDAYVAVANNTESLFYNPASLGRSGYYWRILDPAFGMNGLDSFSNLQSLQSGDFAQAMQDLAGNNIWIGVGGKTAATFGYFGAAYYYDIDINLSVDNPVNPSLDVSYFYDNGVILGVGFPILPVFHMGLTLKRVNRTGGEETFGPDMIADIASGSQSTSAITGAISNTGVGYGMDLGFNFYIPAPTTPTISLVWKDFGNTSFVNVDGGTAPPSDQANMTLGFAMNLDLPGLSFIPAIEYRHMNRSDIPFSKKLHLGAEFGIPLFDFRGGFYQGYYTLGLGMSLGLLQIDMATWGEELGAYAGQKEDRRYMLQMTLELGFDSSLDILSGGKKGSAARRQLKQRR